MLQLYNIESRAKSLKLKSRVNGTKVSTEGKVFNNIMYWLNLIHLHVHVCCKLLPQFLQVKTVILPLIALTGFRCY